MIKDMILRLRILRVSQQINRQHGIKGRFICVEEGCETEISGFRFLFFGCICRMHSWFRRWAR